jgi:hypothetical protein
MWIYEENQIPQTSLFFFFKGSSYEFCILEKVLRIQFDKHSLCIYHELAKRGKPS